MGVYSTVDITRGKAIELLLEATHGNLSDAALEAFMDVLLEPRLLNVCIVSNDQPNSDDLI